MSAQEREEILERVIDPSSSQRLPYRTRDPVHKSNMMHCGQLKLLCMEAHFLTKWASPGDVVVYVGGGNGMHLPTLSRMFPMVHFDVFDTQPLNALILGETSRNFSFMPRKFSVQDAEMYEPMGKSVILLSDVRPQISGNPSSSSSSAKSSATATTEAGGTRELSSSTKRTAILVRMIIIPPPNDPPLLLLPRKHRKVGTEVGSKKRSQKKGK